PAVPTPPEPTAFTNRPISRVLRSRTVGVADGVSVATVPRASGSTARTRPARRASPDGGRERRTRCLPADRRGLTAGRSYTRPPRSPRLRTAPLTPRVRPPEPD